VTPVHAPEAGPALPGGPADGDPVSPATPTATPASPAADPHPASTGAVGGRRTGRVVLVAAVAGAALAGGGARIVAPGGPAGPPTILITAHHSRFEPDRITVKPGSTVRFVVHNSDPIDHEFIIGPPATHELHERGTPHVHTGIVPGEITVPAGTTVETSWTFGPAGSPAVAYGCHLAGHWAYGMHGLAVIR